MKRFILLLAALALPACHSAYAQVAVEHPNPAAVATFSCTTGMGDEEIALSGYELDVTQWPEGGRISVQVPLHLGYLAYRGMGLKVTLSSCTLIPSGPGSDGSKYILSNLTFLSVGASNSGTPAGEHATIVFAFTYVEGMKTH